MTTPVGREKRSGRRVPTQVESPVPYALVALASILADIARSAAASDDVAPRPVQTLTVGSTRGGTNGGPSDRSDLSRNKEPMP